MFSYFFIFAVFSLVACICVAAWCFIKVGSLTEEIDRIKFDANSVENAVNDAEGAVKSGLEKFKKSL